MKLDRCRARWGLVMVALLVPIALRAETIRYRGIRPTDPGGRDGLRNPERGWRIETLIGEPPGARVWGPAAHLRGRTTTGYSDDWWLLDARRYQAEGLTLAQTYCYLTDFIEEPISDEKLAWLERSLNRLRAAGLKAVLRFAYEKDMRRRRGPTTERILQHIGQLEPLLRRHADVIYVCQAGFVGAWGEWHNSAHGIEKNHTQLAAIVARLLQALPPDRMTQVRVPKYKRWILSESVLGPFETLKATNAFSARPVARIGFHDDGFLAGKTDGGTWPEPPHFANQGNPEFDYMTRESAYVPVDGELFWSDQGGVVDGLRAAQRLRLHHYSSFSLAHSYSEREGKPYSMDIWRHTPLTLAQARAARLPVSDGYFADAQGKPVTRTVYEYIRDHLGYRIELQSATFPREAPVEGELTVEIELINRGYSILYNPRPVYLVLIDAAGEVVATQRFDADPRRWQPYRPGDREFRPVTHRVRGHIRLPTTVKPDTSLMLGLWLPDAAERLRRDARYAVRVANRDVPWWTTAAGEYGINILGSVTVHAGSP